MTPPIQEPNMGLNAAVAAELRAQQARVKLSVPKLSEKADIPYGSLRRYLAAERHIDVATLDALAEAMDTTASAIVEAAAKAVVRPSIPTLAEQRAKRTYPKPAAEAAREKDQGE